MRRYRDGQGDSGVLAFEVHEDAIDIRFKDGGVYRYSARQPGAAHVARMRLLALAGAGLNTYINQQVRERYERRLS